MVKNQLRTALAGNFVWPPPVWLFRQAGRYLPEYRKLRSSFPDLLQFMLNADAAATATLQPLQRFPRLDAAIIFSDILLLPWALGQSLDFVPGSGPKMGQFPLGKEQTTDSSLIWPQANWLQRLQPTLTAIRNVRTALPAHKSLIGFAAAPWTLAAYMFSTTPAPLLTPTIIASLVEAISSWLLAQVSAGADVLVIFESWAGRLEHEQVDRYSVNPIGQIINKVKATTSVPIIIFPRATKNWAPYCNLAAEGIAVSQDISINTVQAMLRPQQVVMGNLDPELLLQDNSDLSAAVHQLRHDRQTAQHPFIFNLGHGILPQSSLAAVSSLFAQLG